MVQYGGGGTKKEKENGGEGEGGEDKLQKLYFVNQKRKKKASKQIQKEITKSMKFKTQPALHLAFLNLKHKGNSKVVQDPAS